MMTQKQPKDPYRSIISLQIKLQRSKQPIDILKVPKLSPTSLHALEAVFEKVSKIEEVKTLNKFRTNQKHFSFEAIGLVKAELIQSVNGESFSMIASQVEFIKLWLKQLDYRFTFVFPTGKNSRAIYSIPATSEALTVFLKKFE